MNGGRPVVDGNKTLCSSSVYVIIVPLEPLFLFNCGTICETVILEPKFLFAVPGADVRKIKYFLGLLN